MTISTPNFVKNINLRIQEAPQGQAHVHLVPPCPWPAARALRSLPTVHGEGWAVTGPRGLAMALEHPCCSSSSLAFPGLFPEGAGPQESSGGPHSNPPALCGTSPALGSRPCPSGPDLAGRCEGTGHRWLPLAGGCECPATGPCVTGWLQPSSPWAVRTSCLVRKGRASGV